MYKVYIYIAAIHADMYILCMISHMIPQSVANQRFLCFNRSAVCVLVRILCHDWFSFFQIAMFSVIQ